jgi:protein translocase SecG subunit
MGVLAISPDHLVLAGVLNDVMVYSFRTLFFLSAILLMVIVLLQEGKGGGLASALGGQGAETFGVSSGGVNKVTLFLAGLFLMAALGHALAFDQSVSKALREGRKSKALPENPFKDQGGKEPGPGTKDGEGTEPGKGDGKDKPKDTPKEPVKETPKEAPKDAPKEPVKEAPKEAPKDTPKEPAKDAPKGGGN